MIFHSGKKAGNYALKVALFGTLTPNFFHLEMSIENIFPNDNGTLAIHLPLIFVAASCVFITFLLLQGFIYFVGRRS